MFCEGKNPQPDHEAKPRPIHLEDLKTPKNCVVGRGFKPVQDILNSAQHDYTKNDNVSGSISTDNYKRAHTLDLLCIRRTRIMRIYVLSRCTLVEVDELTEEVVACGVIVGSSLIVGEVVLKGRTREFLGKQISLVQEQSTEEYREKLATEIEIMKGGTTQELYQSVLKKKGCNEGDRCCSLS